MNFKKETAITVLDNLKMDGLDNTGITEVLKEALLMQGFVSSAVSKDYTRLYAKISKGDIVPCFVDYKLIKDKPPFRDIAYVKMQTDKTIIICSRAVKYGGVNEFNLKTQKPITAFTNECKRMNLEYYT